MVTSGSTRRRGSKCWTAEGRLPIVMQICRALGNKVRPTGGTVMRRKGITFMVLPQQHTSGRAVKALPYGGKSKPRAALTRPGWPCYRGKFIRRRRS